MLIFVSEFAGELAQLLIVVLVADCPGPLVFEYSSQRPQVESLQLKRQLLLLSVREHVAYPFELAGEFPLLRMKSYQLQSFDVLHH